jgi:hypothetical protein
LAACRCNERLNLITSQQAANLTGIDVKKQVANLTEAKILLNILYGKNMA